MATLHLLVILAVAAVSQGCQFYPAGEYLRFVRVPESLPVGGEVLQVEVHPRRNLTIQPVDKAEDVEFFRYRAINKTTVSVRLAQSLEDLVDSPNPRNVLKLRLVCDYDDGDDTIMSYLSVTVYVEDVNDHDPEFLNTPYKVSVDELTPTGITIFRGIHAVDGDKPNTPNSELQYAIVAGNDKGKFTLENSPRAALVLRKPLDFDTGDTAFNLTIMAADQGKPPRAATANLQVLVTDSDDLSPKFTRDIYRTQIMEFYPITGKRIHQALRFTPPIHAYDQDRSLNATIRYDIIAGNERHLFSLDPHNGTLFLERELDLDTLPGNTFTLQIQASQDNNPLKTSVARVEVELQDINDNKPQFEVDLYNISIVENLPNGFSVLQVLATDQDQGDNGEFVYHLVDPSQAFSIDGRSGWLTVRNQAKLDREQRPSLSMRVLAREKLPSVVTPASDSFVSVEVTLLDANDNNPVFVPSNLYEFSTTPNIPVGHVVGKVQAKDPDLGRNGMVLFQLQRSNTSAHTSQLTVDPQSGNVVVSDVPLVLGKHTLFVEASDQPANPSERRFSLAVVTVLVEPAKKDLLPDFVGAPYEFWVGSDVPVGTSVGQIRVTDAVNKRRVLYDLLHSYHEGVPFAVEERSGTITVVDNMDNYDRLLYDFEAVVTDEKEITLITNVTIHVVHSDSAFSADSTNEPIVMKFKVRENLSGALVGQLLPVRNTTDPSPWKGVKFMIVSEPEVTEQFAISQDGTVYTQKSLDREHKDSYQLSVIAESGRGVIAHRGFYQIHVTVEDENDNAPKFTKQFYSGHIREDCLPGCRVAMDGPIMAVDSDIGGNAKFHLSLHGEDSRLFFLEPSGYVKLVGKLDREIKDKYVLRVVATDKGNLTSEVVLTIQVDDVNDNPPQFVQMWVHPSENVEIPEPVTSAVLVVVGNKTVVEGSRSLKEKEILPVVSIPETLTVGFPVLRLLAIDKDSGENSTVVYKLVSETYIPEISVVAPYTTHHFTVHPTTCEVTVSGILPPQTEFRLNITATDAGGLEAYVIARVFIKDVNNNPPVFEKSRYYFEIVEGEYTRKLLGHVMASDPDFGENANVTYTLLKKRDSTANLPFMVSFDGIISVVGKLDHETQTSYNFRIMAQDNGPVNRRLRSTVDVEVKVLDVNDNPPVFHNYNKLVKARPVDLSGSPSVLVKSSDIILLPLYTASVPENSPPGTRVARVSANDSDSPVNGNGMFLYHIQHVSNRQHLFAVDSKDGVVTTTTALDFERQSVHNVTIVASDLGHPSLSSTALLMVTVLDVPEEVDEDIPGPIFTHRYYELEVEENTPVPLKLLTLNVSQDFRTRSAAGFTFSVVPGTDSEWFHVERFNGSLYLMINADREKVTRLEVTVQVNPVKKSRGFPHMIFPASSTDLAPNEVKVVLRIKDANDNSPQFPLNGRPLVAAIPTSATYGFPIARLQATDADEGLNAEVRYQILGGEADYFTIDAVSGHVRAVASFAHQAGHVFGFDVKATDRAGAHDGRSAIANVFVYVLNEQKKLALIMNAKPIDVEDHVDNITKVLSNITGLDVRLRMLEPHKEDTGEYTDATDMYLYAVDPIMNVIVDMETLNEVLSSRQDEVKRSLEPLHVLEVAGTGAVYHSPPRAIPHPPRAPLLTGLEVVTIVLGCVVFLGALTAAFCVVCLSKKRSKKMGGGYPINSIDLSMSKQRLDCKPRSLFYSGAFVEDTSDSYISQRSDCARHMRHGRHRHAPSCVRHHSRRRAPARSPSTKQMLELSLASLHSSARDSGIGDPGRRGRCACGHSTSHSSANSSNGSYEDSLKSLHRHQSHSSGGSAGGVGGGGCTGHGGEFTLQRHQRKDSISMMQPPPPPFPGSALVRRPSERMVIAR
ncbi:cadherin-89D-like [Macrosteles quadrilineatus]|uniref:cadherin-89D-like n=1 Tax=Macrosteles quadrilineatus TaxID=74068 RepID=UPI0023E2B4F1|nr:cadherin-89D-like [Macrosteles quadrilineatus]